MPATLSPLPDASIEAILPALQGALDSLSTLYAAAKLAHWNVRGPHRAPLHKLFGHVADAAQEHTDIIAERLMQLGGIVAPSSCDAPPVKDTDGLVICETLAQQIGQALLDLNDVRDITNEQGDLDSLDILTAATRPLEKHGANVLAYLG